MRLSLPIDPLLPEIAASLRGNPNLVLQADPGAGKTTRVPPALLGAGLLGEGECWVLEPRRLAARLAATRVADELGEPLGQRAGYAVRFEQKVSKRTRLRFVTEGLLLRRLQADPLLRGIAAVVLDEFHERHLDGDLALALLRRLQRTARPDLKLVVMSATLDAGPVARFLDAPALRSEGRAFPVERDAVVQVVTFLLGRHGVVDPVVQQTLPAEMAGQTRLLPLGLPPVRQDLLGEGLAALLVDGVAARAGVVLHQFRAVRRVGCGNRPPGPPG